MQATPTPFRTYPAAALWHEADGLHVDQPARILWCLKLATSYFEVLDLVNPELDELLLTEGIAIYVRALGPLGEGSGHRDEKG